MNFSDSACVGGKKGKRTEKRISLRILLSLLFDMKALTLKEKKKEGRGKEGRKETNLSVFMVVDRSVQPCHSSPVQSWPRSNVLSTTVVNVVPPEFETVF